MKPLILREPLDCENCAAPCCQLILFSTSKVESSVLGRTLARADWRAAGARLVEVLPGAFDWTHFPKQPD